VVGFVCLAIPQIGGRECVSVAEKVVHPRCTPRRISSMRAGVPRRRTHRLGYCSTGDVNSKFLSNQTGTLSISSM
jgi:hypothetical protein